MRMIHSIAIGLLLVFVAGCSSVFNHDNFVQIVPAKKKESADPLTKYSATLRVAGYVDERKTTNPRKIGIGAHMVIGLSGNDILLDRPVADYVTQAMKDKFDDAGFQVVDSNEAVFELSGTIKELTYNVKARDEVEIAIETVLKETASGKVVWSAMVKEKVDRFAGVSGNDRKDVAYYLNRELGIVVQKTMDAASTSLMAARPELFNLTPGAKPVAGVTVYVAPNANAAAPHLPAALPVKGGDKQPDAGNGMLSVTTVPARSKVYVDGVYYGLSPLRVELTPGVRTVNAKAEGYRPVSEKVSVRRGDNTELELVLEK